MSGNFFISEEIVSRTTGNVHLVMQLAVKQPTKNPRLYFLQTKSFPDQIQHLCL